MGSFGLQKSCHPVWQRVVELVDEVIGDGMEGYLLAALGMELNCVRICDFRSV